MAALPKRGHRTSTNSAKKQMGELMHRKVARKVQQKEQTNKGAKRN